MEKVLAGAFLSNSKWRENTYLVTIIEVIYNIEVIKYKYTCTCSHKV